MISQKLSVYCRLMRLHKPIGILLLLWPTLWALWIAGEGKPDFKITLIFILGVIVMRSAGCIINDIADRNIDKFISRTKTRPLTSGEVSLKEAYILFSLLLFIALILALQLNLFTIQLSIFALFLACLYPFTKRYIYWPQLFLGLAFAMSVPMAFTAILNHLNFISLIIYSIAVLWPLMYDTQYAMVDREDDLKIGVKSTAILFGKYEVLIIGLLQLIIISLLMALGIILKFNLFYFITVLFSALLFAYQLYLISDRVAEQCFKAFLNNQWIGMMIFFGIAGNFILQNN
jgi:4-hydroxybenzoate polyprenyltransferase